MVNTWAAKQAFKRFTGKDASLVRKIKLDRNNVSAWKLGDLVGVAYEATRDGKRSQYFHKFRKRDRPALGVRADGRQLYIASGKYHVTERGIEDGQAMPYAFLVNPSPRAGLHRRRSPMAVRRRRRRRSTQVAVFRANPRRRVRHRRRRSVVRYLTNPVRRHRRTHRVRRMRFRRNPIGTGLSLRTMLIPAVGIGIGAVGSEVVMGYLPLPASLKTGVMRHVTKGVVSVAAGIVLARFLKMKRLGEAFALGGIAIAAHDAVKEFIVARAPNVQFGDYGMYMPSRRMGGFGYVNPARAPMFGRYLNVTPGAFDGAASGNASNATAGIDDYSGV
jgi:hypothetical protein